MSGICPPSISPVTRRAGHKPIQEYSTGVLVDEGNVSPDEYYLIEVFKMRILLPLNELRDAC